MKKFVFPVSFLMLQISSATSSADERFKDPRDKLKQCMDNCDHTVTFGNRIVVTPNDQGIRAGSGILGAGASGIGGVGGPGGASRGEPGAGGSKGPSTAAHQTATQIAIQIKISQKTIAISDFIKFETQLSAAIEISEKKISAHQHRISSNKEVISALEYRINNSQSVYNERMDDLAKNVAEGIKNEIVDAVNSNNAGLKEKLETAKEALEGYENLTSAYDALMAPHVLPDEIGKLEAENQRLQAEIDSSKAAAAVWQAARDAAESARKAAERELERLEAAKQ